MKGEKYLSEIGLTPDRFKKGKVNIIECPTGAGKTHFSFNELPRFTESNYCILYITDTRMNREQILAGNDNTVDYDKSWRELINETPKEKIVKLHKNAWGSHADIKITIMTYAKVGAVLHYGHPFDWSKFDYVVCDELQNLIKWQNIRAKNEDGKPLAVNILELTQKKIEQTLYSSDTIIIALTATPDKVKKAFENCFDVLTPHEYGSLYQYENTETIYYRDCVKVLEDIPQGKRGIIFFYQISQLKRAESILSQAGHKTASIWSIENKDHPMSERQLEIRRHIIHNQKIPHGIDILLINSACETGVNIKNDDIDFVMVQSMDEDTITQARGRLRGDLSQLYLYSNLIYDTQRPVPEKYLNRPLTAEEKKALCEEIRYLSPKNQPYMWVKVKPYLEINGYKITDKTIKNVRVSIIEKPQ